MIRKGQIEEAFFKQFGHDGSRVQFERVKAQFKTFAEKAKRGDKL